MNIDIVVPAHNEEERIAQTVRGLLAHVRNSRVIVVCDGCTDNTPAIAHNLASHSNRVSVIVKNKQSGKGAAVLTGLRAATGDVVGFVDADGSFSPQSVNKVIRHLDDYDVVIASKWKGRKTSGMDARTFAGRVWNALTRALLGLDFTDTQAGLKFFKKKALPTARSYKSAGFEFDVELLWRLKRAGFSIGEVYVPVRASTKSTFSFAAAPKMFLSLILMRIRQRA